jgi:hypothetical protein
MPWKPLVQLEGAIHASLMNPVLNCSTDFWLPRISSMRNFTPGMDTMSCLFTMPQLCKTKCSDLYFFLIRSNMFYAIAPLEFHSELLVVDVETEGTITSGTMVSDTFSHALRVLYLKYMCRCVTGVGAGNAGAIHMLLVQLSFIIHNSCAPLSHNLRDCFARPNAVVCTRVRESSLWSAVVTAIRFLDGNPSSSEISIPVPPVTKFSTPVVRVGVGAVVRRVGDPSILLGLRQGSHGAG